MNNNMSELHLAHIVSNLQCTITSYIEFHVLILGVSQSKGNYPHFLAGEAQ